jgi:dTMP kinase
MNSMRGKFIVIDGMDGSGKGLQIGLLKSKLEGKGVVFTREPGGTPKAEQIRSLILDTTGAKSTALSDLFLFCASRASHVEDLIEPLRTNGTHVISDRYDSSTFAFQIEGEEHPELIGMYELVREALRRNPAYIPDAYLFLDLPAEVAYARRSNDSTKEKDRFDLQPVEYHERVRQGFKKFAERYGSSHIVDAHRTAEEVHADIWKIVMRTLGI